MQRLAGQPALQLYAEGLLKGLGYDKTRRPESFCTKAYQSARWKAKMKPEMKVHTYWPKQWNVEFSGGEIDCIIGTVAIEFTCMYAWMLTQSIEQEFV